jgi:hypothetical protein
LCGGGEEPKREEVKQEENEIIDLTLDEEENEPRSNFTAAPVLAPQVEGQPEATFSRGSSLDVLDLGQFPLAEDETQMTTHELLECLSAGELKKFAKEMKLKLNSTVCPLSLFINSSDGHIRTARDLDTYLGECFIYTEDDQLSCCLIHLIRVEAEDSEADDIAIRYKEEDEDTRGKAT